ncbi:MAG: HAD-IC family P-type ATPase, partial [Pseudomonadota bacterium]
EAEAPVDESMLTGEQPPVEKSRGDAVIGGSVTAGSGFTMQAERVGAETRIAQTLSMLAQATRSRSPLQAVADRVERWFALSVVGVAIATFVLWAMWGPAPAFDFGLLAAVSVLIIASLYALSVAGPMSITAAIARLQRQDMVVMIATGDAAATGESVGGAVGVAEVFSDQSPEDKASLVGRLQGQGYTVAVAGDGVTDAPALAKADVGVAMAAGAGMAIESAGLTVLIRDLHALARARALAKATQRTMRQNLTFALVYNGLGVPIAAGALYPFFGLVLSPMIAAVALNASSVFLIGNALRLRNANLSADPS